MKKRRFLSLIVAMLMVMSSCLPALATTYNVNGLDYDDATGENVVTSTHSVEITGIPYDVELTTGSAGISFTTYQILYAVYDESTNTIEYKLTDWAKAALTEGSSSAYTSEAEAIAAILASENIATTITPTPSPLPSTAGTETTEQTDVLNILAAYITTYSASVDSFETTYNSGSDLWTYSTGQGQADGSASATLPVGAYLVVPTSSNMSFLNTMVSVNAEAGTASANEWTFTSKGAVLKGTRVNITKQVKEEDDTDFADSTDAQIGETVTYQLKVLVPQYDAGIDNSAITFSVEDEPTNVSIDASSVTVTPHDSSGAAGSALTSGTDFTVNGGGVDANGDPQALTINLNNNNYQSLYGLNNGAYPYEYVIIEYTATVLSSADAGSNGNENTATLTYGHDNNNNTAVETALVYTYQAQLTKTDETGSTNLAGAEFTITPETSAGSGTYTTALQFVKYSDGNYSVYDGTSTFSSPVEIVDAVTTDSNGNLIITGLDASTNYKIVESVAPSGYTLNTNYLIFSINGSAGQVTGDPTAVEYLADGSIVSSGNTWSTGYDTTNTVHYMTMSLTNTKLASIPSTGGVGIVIFTVLGVCLMIVAVFLLNSKDSKKKQAQ